MNTSVDSQYIQCTHEQNVWCLNFYWYILFELSAIIVYSTLCMYEQGGERGEGECAFDFDDMAK